MEKSKKLIKGIGGSDIGAIAGLNRWKSELSVYLDKIGEASPKEETEAMYWGKILEDIIACEFQKRFETDKNIKLLNQDRTLVHPEYDFMVANIDREIVFSDGTKGVLECKTTGEFGKGNWVEDEIPAECLLQVQWYLMITGYEVGYIAILIGGNKFVYKKIEANLEIQEHLKNIAINFWDNLNRREMPEPDGGEDADNVLKQLYPNSSYGKSINLDCMKDELEELIEMQFDLDKLDIKIETKRQKIKAAMKKAELANIGERQIIWKSYTSNRFDMQTFREEMPDIYKKYCKSVSSRRFAIK